MLGAYNSEKGICLEHTNRKKQLPWSIQFYVWSIQIGFRGAYNSVTFSGNTKSMDPSVALSPLPRKREPALSQLLCGIAWARRQPTSPNILGGDIFCLCEYLQPDRVLERWGGLQTPCRNSTIGCPQNVTRRSPPKTAPEDIPQGYPQRDPPRVSFEDVSRGHPPRISPEEIL